MLRLSHMLRPVASYEATAVYRPCRQFCCDLAARSSRAGRMVVAAPRRERRHGSRRIANALKPIVVVFAALYFLIDAIFRLEGSDDSCHKTPRVHHAARRYGGRVARGSPCAAAEDGDRWHPRHRQHESRSVLPADSRRAWGGRPDRGPEHPAGSALSRRQRHPSATDRFTSRPT